MITITIAQAIRAAGAIERLSQKELPVRAAWRANKIVRAIAPEIHAFEEEKAKLIEKYSELSDEAKGKLVSELNELAREEIQIHLDPIPLSIVEDAGISMADMQSLEWMFQE